jgi:hypothetical protein
VKRDGTRLTWTVLSDPMRQKTEAGSPTKKESVWLSQPPKFKNVVKTSLGGAWGPRYTIGIKTQKKPARWRIRMNPSNRARSLPEVVLIRTAKKTIAQYRRRVCQFFGTYVGSFRAIMPWMTVPRRYPADATDACQPVTVTQPVKQLSKSEIGAPWSRRGGHTSDEGHIVSAGVWSHHSNPMICRI